MGAHQALPAQGVPALCGLLPAPGEPEVPRSHGATLCHPLPPCSPHTTSAFPPNLRVSLPHPPVTSWLRCVVRPWAPCVRKKATTRFQPCAPTMHRKDPWHFYAQKLHVGSRVFCPHHNLPAKKEAPKDTHKTATVNAKRNSNMTPQQIVVCRVDSRKHSSASMRSLWALLRLMASSWFWSAA